MRTPSLLCLFGSLLLLALCGCGNKGDLVLPERSPEGQAPATAPPPAD